MTSPPPTSNRRLTERKHRVERSVVRTTHRPANPAAPTDRVRSHPRRRHRPGVVRGRRRRRGPGAVRPAVQPCAGAAAPRRGGRMTYLDSAEDALRKEIKAVEAKIRLMETVTAALRLGMLTLFIAGLSIAIGKIT